MMTKCPMSLKAPLSSTHTCPSSQSNRTLIPHPNSASENERHTHLEMLQSVIHHIPPKRRSRTPHYRIPEFRAHTLCPLMMLRSPPIISTSLHPSMTIRVKGGLTLGWLGCAGFWGF